MAHDRQTKEGSTRAPESAERDYARKFSELISTVLAQLCATYNVDPTTILMDVWSKAVEDVRPEVIKAGLVQTLKSHKEFMPTPGQFREYCEVAASRMKYAPESLEKQRRVNVLDEVREIAREIYTKYDKLDAKNDAKKIEKLFRHANIVRYLRAGIEPNWITKGEVDSVRKFA